MSKSKDPAVLFYISDWLTSTAGMDADCRGWYLNLLLHNYDKKELPNDVEALAVLAGVKFSEFERFKQVLEQVLKQKFEVTSEGGLTNPKASSIMRTRETFKEKRQRSGNAGVIMRRFYAENLGETFDKELIKKLLYLVTDEELEEIKNAENKQVLNHLLNHLLKLYENENENENKDVIVNKNKKYKIEKSIKELNVHFDIFWDMYGKKIDRAKCEKKWNKLTDEEREQCIYTLPAYILATPEIKYRRNPETYLNNKSWNNQIVINDGNKKSGATDAELIELYARKYGVISSE